MNRSHDGSENSGQVSGLRSLLGETRDGQPLSLNRAPIPELRPFVCRIYATNVLASDDNLVECGIFSDMPMVRFVFGGEWIVETADGTIHCGPGVYFFGPQTKRMPVTVRGPFSTVSMQFQPGAVAAINGPDLTQCVNRMALLEDVWPDASGEWLGAFRQDASVHEWLEVTERCLLGIFDDTSPDKVSDVTRAFDRASFVDPNLRIADFAEEEGITTRTVTRIVNRDFGVPPKKALSRARALDLAASLRGLNDEREHETPALRYFDQSHMIRDFTKVFDMTPSVFAKTPQPILTLTLETRQMRKFEALGYMGPDDLPSWRKPEAEPGLPGD